jgi:hypothetical protein
MLGNPSYVTEKIIEGETEGMYKDVFADCLKEVLQLYSTGTVEPKKIGMDRDSNYVFGEWKERDSPFGISSNVNYFCRNTHHHHHHHQRFYSHGKDLGRLTREVS